jgi:hypothetical protein
VHGSGPFGIKLIALIHREGRWKSIAHRQFCLGLGNVLDFYDFVIVFSQMQRNRVPHVEICI